jgi:hypothetical protein
MENRLVTHVNWLNLLNDPYGLAFVVPAHRMQLAAANPVSEWQQRI